MHKHVVPHYQKNMELENLIEEEFKKTNYENRTIQTYKSWILKFFDFVKIDDIQKIQFQNIVDFVDYLKTDTNYSLSTQRQAISSLESLFNNCLDKNFSFKEIKISRPTQETPVVLTKYEINAIISSIQNLKQRTAISVIYALGLSPEELVTIQLKDYNKTEGLIHVRKKGEIYRDSIVGDSLELLLLKYLEIYNPKNFLFENDSTHKQYSKGSLRKIFNKAKEHLGLNQNYTLQNLKYSYVKHLVDEGFQLTDVLNHIKLKNYEVYSRIDGLHNTINYSPIDSLNKKEKKLNFKVTNEQAENFVFTDEQTKIILESKPELIKSFVENDINDSDIIAIGYRKKQLEKFNKLLNDEKYFIKELELLGNSSKENLWQTFFESNTWIFGYGLNFVFSTNLEDKKIEQVVSGFSFNESGKRVDGLLKTRGIISSLCFVEIKNHDTKLLNIRKYRADCWNISNELSGAVSQIQKTVQKSITNLPTQNRINDSNGNPTNEIVYLYKPKAYLIVGNLSEFLTEHGVNESKYSSFELFRQNTSSPEIITYDELFERAKFLLDNETNK
jgi:site-specific recombinase XerD